MKILLIFQKQKLDSEEDLFLNETIQSFARSGYQVQIYELCKGAGLLKFFRFICAQSFNSLHLICFKKQLLSYKLALKLMRISYTCSFSSRNARALPISMEFLPHIRENVDVENLNFPIYATKTLVDKNQGVEEFCQLDLKGSKIIFGHGPMLEKYKKKYGSKVLFYPMGHFKKMSHLINVFIYTKKKSVAPMYVVQALSYSIPVASLENPAVENIIKKRVNGFIANDLELAALECLNLERGDCFQSAKAYFMNDRFKELAHSCLVGLSPMG